MLYSPSAQAEQVVDPLELYSPARQSMGVDDVSGHLWPGIGNMDVIKDNWLGSCCSCCCFYCCICFHCYIFLGCYRNGAILKH